jgi:hypothetical protein
VTAIPLPTIADIEAVFFLTKIAESWAVVDRVSIT